LLEIIERFFERILTDMKGIYVENVVSNVSKFDQNLPEYISKTILEIFLEIFWKQPRLCCRAGNRF
jgi:hypothetical protein